MINNALNKNRGLETIIKFLYTCDVICIYYINVIHSRILLLGIKHNKQEQINYDNTHADLQSNKKNPEILPRHYISNTELKDRFSVFSQFR